MSTSRKRPCSSDEDSAEFKGASIKLALGDLYQETVQLRSDVKELQQDVHNVLKNQDQLSQHLKNIAEILANSNNQKPAPNVAKDDVTSDSSEEKNLVDGASQDDVDDIGSMLQEQSCQTEPVTILPDDIIKSNMKLRNDIKSVLQNQSTLSINMKNIYDLVNSKKNSLNSQFFSRRPENQPTVVKTSVTVEESSGESNNANDDDDEVEEIVEVEPSDQLPSVEMQCDPEAGPSYVVEDNTPSPIALTYNIPIVPNTVPASGSNRPVPKIIPGPYTGTFLVGGDSTLVRDISEYESILMQIYTKKPDETEIERARGLLRHLFRMIIPPEILATCNVTGKSRDAVTHRWIRVPKIDEALLLPIFNQTRFQFPSFTDWYTDEKSRTVQYLNNVCKTVRHSAKYCSKM